MLMCLMRTFFIKLATIFRIMAFERSEKWEHGGSEGVMLTAYTTTWPHQTGSTQTAVLRPCPVSTESSRLGWYLPVVLILAA
jgi:hypothetical protein